MVPLDFRRFKGTICHWSLANSHMSFRSQLRRFRKKGSLSNSQEREYGEPGHHAVYNESGREAAAIVECIGGQNRHRAQSAGIGEMSDRQQSPDMLFSPEHLRQNEREK